MIVLVFFISQSSAYSETWQEQITVPYPEYYIASNGGTPSYGLTNNGGIYTDTQFAYTSINCGIFFGTDYCSVGIYKLGAEPTTYAGWTMNGTAPGRIFVGIADASGSWE
jgi:hypothetical protein